MMKTGCKSEREEGEGFEGRGGQEEAGETNLGTDFGKAFGPCFGFEGSVKGPWNQRAILICLEK